MALDAGVEVSAAVWSPALFERDGEGRDHRLGLGASAPVGNLRCGQVTRAAEALDDADCGGGALLLGG